MPSSDHHLGAQHNSSFACRGYYDASSDVTGTLMRGGGGRGEGGEGGDGGEGGEGGGYHQQYQPHDGASEQSEPSSVHNLMGDGSDLPGRRSDTRTRAGRLKSYWRKCVTHLLLCLPLFLAQCAHTRARGPLLKPIATASCHTMR